MENAHFLHKFIIIINLGKKPPNLTWERCSKWKTQLIQFETIVKEKQDCYHLIN
jgi:hypothetical protein